MNRNNKITTILPLFLYVINAGFNVILNIVYLNPRIWILFYRLLLNHLYLYKIPKFVEKRKTIIKYAIYFVVVL